MIKKALEYLVGLGEANISDVTLPDGTLQAYSDKPLQRLDSHIPMAEPVNMSTLSSFVEYIKSHVDSMADKMIIHVASPEEVLLYSQLNKKDKGSTW